MNSKQSILQYNFVHNFYMIEGEFWYFSNDLFAEEGNIRSISEGDMSVPQQGWQYYDHSYFDVNNFDECRTDRLYIIILIIL